MAKSLEGSFEIRNPISHRLCLQPWRQIFKNKKYSQFLWRNFFLGGGFLIYFFYQRKRSFSGKLTKSEEMQVGDITWGTYFSYVNAMGGICVAIFVITCSILTSGSVVFSDWWLSIWINTFYVWGNFFLFTV